MIKAVIYDVDGTLINSEPIHITAWDAALKEYGSCLNDLPVNFQDSMAGRKPVDIATDMVALLNLKVSGIDLFDKKTAMLLRALEGGVEEIPGAVNSINRFHDQGLRLGIGAALGRKYVDLVLSKLGISEAVFKVIITGDQISKGKPDPETYSAAVNELGLSPEECVVLEDAKSGIASAKGAGCYCIAITNSLAPEQDLSLADCVVRSWREVTISTLKSLEFYSRPIVVTAKETDWKEAQKSGEYIQSTVDSALEDVGFIHCSFPSEVMDMINRKYADQDDLVLLFADPNKVKSEIKYESSLSGRQGPFPHIYGPLNVDAVFRVVKLEKASRGEFIASKALSLSDFFRYPGITLGLVTEAELGDTVALINSAYAYQDKYKGEPRISIDRLRKRKDEVDFFVAMQGKRVVGCVYVENVKKSVHFGLLTLAPNLRGSGLAPALISAVEDYSKALGAKQVELDYMSAAPWLKSYYERYGYSETGAVIRWGTIDLIRMSKPLKR